MHLPVRATRARVGLVAVAALVATTFASTTSAPAEAVQASGHDVAAWANGWAWTYATRT